MTEVVDASVVVKWVLAEAGREASLTLLNAYEAGAADLIAPRTLMDEVASALSKRCRRGQINTKQASAAFAFLEQRTPILIHNNRLVREALDLSLLHHLSLWDCLYLALAIRYRCDLTTADHRFYRAAQKHYPFVVLLGS
jgi:predicted nucleic acid-binding protein